MPDEKVTFYSADPDNPVREVGLTNVLTLEAETVKFTKGTLTTSDPGIVPALEALLHEGYPVTKTPPRKGSPNA